MNERTQQPPPPPTASRQPAPEPEPRPLWAEWLTERFDARIDAVESHLSSRIDAVESHLNSRIDALESRLNMLMWMMGISIALSTLHIAAMQFWVPQQIERYISPLAANTAPAPAPIIVESVDLTPILEAIEALREEREAGSPLGADQPQEPLPPQSDPPQVPPDAG